MTNRRMPEHQLRRNLGYAADRIDRSPDPNAYHSQTIAVIIAQALINISESLADISERLPPALPLDTAP